MNSEDVLQQRLERLEAGETLDVCQNELPEEEADLLALAADLRAVAWPERDRQVVRAQRTQLLNLVARREAPQKSFASWLRSWRLPAVVAAVGIVLILCAGGTLFGGGMLWHSFRDRPLAQTPPAPVATEPRYTVFVPVIETNRPLTPGTAVVHLLEGVLEIRGDARWEPLADGQRVQVGDSLRTGSLSSASLTFYDGSQASLGPNTEVRIVELDAQADAPRVIVLEQLSGETRHEVAHATVEDSRYEVLTPSARGEAKGTVFHVAVTPDQGSRFDVTEGQVAVTGADVTVLVDAGEITTVNTDEEPDEPNFFISGEGGVSQIGDIWLIAGQPFEVHAGTLIIGDPRIGDWVSVQGRLLPDGRRIADLITLLRRNPADRFTLTGEVETMAGTLWTVAGQTIVLSDTTTIDEGIAVGDLVRVQGIILDDGSLQAESIRLLETAPGLPFDFTGVIQTIGEDVWTISGVNVAVSDTTVLGEGLASGDLVRVCGWILDDGVWLATHITRVLEEPPSFEFTGILESMDPWQVAGIAFEVREWTSIDADLALGDMVRVKGHITDGGTWVAFEVELLDDETDVVRIILIGVVDSIDPWIVSGVPLTVTDTTIIDDGIAVGTLVRVIIEVAPDGSRQVVRITPLRPHFGLGCLGITGTIVGIDGNRLRLRNWPELILDEGVNIEGELQAGAVVHLQLCFAGDMSVKVVVIVIISPPEPGVTPPGPADPPGGEEKVTLCHKPDSKNPHTITVSKSAVPAHLRHGDVPGNCP